MVIFMIYYMITFLFQFFTVGAMYASVTIFLKQQLGTTIESASYNGNHLYLLLINGFFDYFYIGLICMALIMSLTTPVDRGVIYFKALMVIFGLLLVFSMVGVIGYLVDTGFYPKVMEYREDRWPRWQPKIPEERYISILVCSGVVMCAVYLIPIILRPLDFLMNLRVYLIGLVSYMFMMPTFINVMQVYAMCNLHDISWGNRPS